MNKVYGFLLMVLLLGVAVIADVLTYINIGGDFFIVEVFVLGTLLVLSVFLFGSWLGSLFSLTVFSITLLTAMISFHSIFPADKGILAILLMSGIAGFIASLCVGCCKKKCCCNKQTCSDMPIPQMTFPAAKATRRSGVSTYDVENDAPSVEPVEFTNEDFVELNELENLVKKTKGRKKKK
ncbi:MAG: hypothetical protein WC254_04660 [Candidatus Woesearchaeota archaeon]|jgi:hypothetical protein